MRKNKLIRTILISTMLVVSMLAGVACGSGNGTDISIGSQDDKNNNNNGNTNESKKFYFTVNNVKVTPNDLMAPLLTALGSDYQYFESASCAYTGLDKCYVYKDYTIYTYPDEKTGEDHVLQVVITADTAKTNEGVTVGDAASKVVETYGSNYTESEGSYAYESGGTTLIFIIKNDRIYSIQYSTKDAK